MKRNVNRECKSLYFIFGNFPRCGNSSSRCVTITREDEVFRFNSGIPVANEIDLQRVALNSLVEKFLLKDNWEMNFHVNKVAKSFSLIISKRKLRTLRINQFAAFIKNRVTINVTFHKRRILISCNIQQM